MSQTTSLAVYDDVDRPRRFPSGTIAFFASMVLLIVSCAYVGAVVMKPKPCPPDPPPAQLRLDPQWLDR